jgi:hypothetical protein
MVVATPPATPIKVNMKNKVLIASPHTGGGTNKY